MVAAAVVTLGWPPLRSTVFSIITGRVPSGCAPSSDGGAPCSNASCSLPLYFRILILAYTLSSVIHEYTRCTVSKMPLAALYLALLPSTVITMISCATWSIIFILAALVDWIRRREGSCWLRELRIFEEYGWVRLGWVWVRHCFPVASYGRKDQSINRSVVNTPPLQKRILWQCRSVNFILCRSVNFIWCQFLTSCMGGYVISTWFSIVCEPKNSIMRLCGMCACQYNDGYLRDLTDQDTSGKMK